MAKITFDVGDGSPVQEFEVTLPTPTTMTGPTVEVVLDIDPNTTTATVISAVNK